MTTHTEMLDSEDDLDQEMRTSDGVMLIMLILASAGALTMAAIAYLASLI